MAKRPKTPKSAQEQIGRYVIQRELGRGTMGVVYQAHDPVLGRAIALKTIHLASFLSERQRAAYEQRFLAEARIAAQLQHPGIVVVHDLGRDPETGVLFIALELLVGETLADWIAEDRRPSWQEALRVVARAAEALHHAHERGIVHRDVKPANIMVLKNGAPKIMDFGIAKIDTSNLTSPGELFGTPLYMSPEQALARPVDARSDLFSLGSIAYTLLTGHPPFRAPDVPGILARVAHLDPQAPSEAQSGLPADVDYALARAMAKEPERRYACGRDLAEDLDDIRAGRPPRHRGDWAAPDRGGETVASQRPPAPTQEGGQPAAGRKRKRGPRRVFALALLAVGAAFAVLELRPDVISFWRAYLPQMAPGLTEPTPAPASSPVLSPMPDTEATPAPPAVSPTAEGTPLETSALASDGSPPAGTPTQEAAIELAPPATTPAVIAPRSPSPRSALSPVPSQAATPQLQAKDARRPTPTPATGAQLRVEFEHAVTSGTLRVWVDERLAVTEKLAKRTARRIVLDEKRKGVTPGAFGLVPGPHTVRIEVRWGKSVRSARTTATFAAGTTRRLAAALSQGKLTLRWK
jgi:hypothetical protein